MPPDLLAWVIFSAELPSETVEISNSIHKTSKELAIKFCLTIFSFTPTPLKICSRGLMYINRPAVKFRVTWQPACFPASHVTHLYMLMYTCVGLHMYVSKKISIDNHELHVSDIML